MLELYKRIRERRQQLDMTQAELAAKTGYSDKSMIAKIEKGNIDLPLFYIIVNRKVKDFLIFFKKNKAPGFPEASS